MRDRYMISRCWTLTLPGRRKVDEAGTLDTWISRCLDSPSPIGYYCRGLNRGYGWSFSPLLLGIEPRLRLEFLSERRYL